MFSHSTDYKYLEKNVVVDNNVITSRGPGTSFEFAFHVLEYFVKHKAVGEQVLGEVMRPMMVDIDLRA